MKKVVRVGSRESKLAVAQSRLVMAAIQKQNPEIEVELVTMKTTGDIILDKTLDKIGGKGLFVKELDKALLDEKVDICVHSYKDMPIDDNPELPVVAVSKRENPYDVLVLPEGTATFDKNKPVGCASARRCIQFQKLYPDWELQPVRGNVLTRLDKMMSGQYSALILAAAGLERLELTQWIYKRFTLEEMVPAACQGILSVQARKGEDVSFLSGFHDIDSYDVSQAERGFIRELDGGCSSPVAAFAQANGAKLLLTGIYVNENGEMFRDTLEGFREDATEIGKTLADTLRKRGTYGG